jgi:Cof subfamily protein (haloacid dehalogenase superfamily)
MQRPRPARISLLLADVDGTLVTKEKVLTKRARHAVHAMHDAGIRFAITSGRPPKGMSMLFQPLAIETPIAGFNGGLFTKADMTIIESHTLDAVASRKTAEMIEKEGLDVWIYAGDDWLIRKADAPHREREEHTVRFPPKVVERWTDDIWNKVVKITGVSDDLDKVAAVEMKLRDVLGNTASAARSQPYYLDVTNPNANKGSVVAYLARTLGIPAGEIATIGDMPNDVLMFKPSGFSIAMGNAAADVQGQADAVTDGFEDEGFAKAVERFILQGNA